MQEPRRCHVATPLPPLVQRGVAEATRDEKRKSLQNHKYRRRDLNPHEISLTGF